MVTNVANIQEKVFYLTGNKKYTCLTVQLNPVNSNPQQLAPPANSTFFDPPSGHFLTNFTLADSNLR